MICELQVIIILQLFAMFMMDLLFISTDLYFIFCLTAVSPRIFVAFEGTMSVLIELARIVGKIKKQSTLRRA
jgi:hypothetical protein